MGMVRVQIDGSFSDRVDVTFPAEEGGHAFALTRAIETLVSHLPDAIRMDHSLAAEGEHPPCSPFGEAAP